MPWKVIFPRTSDLALDLLERLLAFNPVKRISVVDALQHPYLEPYHDPEDEPTADAIPEEFSDFDKRPDSLSKEDLKVSRAVAIDWRHLLTNLYLSGLIYEEIMR